MVRARCRGRHRACALGHQGLITVARSVPRGAVASGRLVLALNQVVNRLDHGLAKIHTHFLRDGHQRLSELIEGLLRLPDVECLKLVAGAEASVIQTTSGFTCTSCVETPEDFVVLRRSYGCRIDVNADCHESLPELADSCGRTAGSCQDACPAARSCSRVFHTTGSDARARKALRAVGRGRMNPGQGESGLACDNFPYRGGAGEALRHLPGDRESNEASTLPARLWTLLFGETYRKRVDEETRDEIAAAAAAHRELGRGYDEAVAEGLVERIGAEIDKRIDARLGVSPRRSRSEVETSQVSRHQAMWTGAVIGAGITGVAAMFAEAGHSPHLWAVAVWIIVVAMAGLSPAVARRYRSQSQS